MPLATFARSSFATLAVVSVTACTVFASDTLDAERTLQLLDADIDHDDSGNVISVSVGLFNLVAESDLGLLTAFGHLTELDISEMSVGSTGWKHVGSLPSLRRLCAAGTKCTDQDLAYLEDLTALEEVILSETAVTDRCVDWLLQLPELRSVDISFTRVTSDGLARLRKEKPSVRIVQYWNYYAGVSGGRRMLDTDRFTIFFDPIDRSRAGFRGGGGGGGAIQVSGIEEDQDRGTSSGRGGTWRRSFSASVSYPAGIPTIHALKHEIEITDDGQTLVIDGESFSLIRGKLRLVMTRDGCEPQELGQTEAVTP